MNIEKTFNMIKWDGINHEKEIYRMLEPCGKILISVRIDCVPREFIEEHYSIHKGKSFFDYMVESFVGNPAIISIREGEDVIRKTIETIGPTDPSKAPEYTIRGKFSNDSLEKAISEHRPVQNVIHRSDSPEEAAREIKVWERYFLLDYN